MTVEPIRGANFDEKLNQATRPVAIDFWQADCPPCQALEPRLELVAQAYADRVKVYRLDIDKHPSIPERYDVMSIPTLIFFKNRKPVKRLDGLITREDLEAAFREVLRS